MAMTTRKRRFADAILKGLNPTEAAVRAGYSGKTARVKGWQLARDPAVKKYLTALTGGATFPVTQPKKVTRKVTSGRVTGGGPELMDNGLPDPLKAMGKILMDNIDTDPKLALDAAYKLAQFTHYRKWNAGKKAAKAEAARKAGNRFPTPEPPKFTRH
ncbi:TPA: terminase small subunit [Escherichia coli]|nr:terminase small subunit [Escherichia coli]HEL8042501.1 terminase small subunit [Escherichia coli]HEL8048561.1 terminase small subunit [Escherichia coli]HEL8052176.1 terminase small subunit [Escherichia coli]HEL8055579.1 terminase small subunit [Escherichia coli]